MMTFLVICFIAGVLAFLLRDQIHIYQVCQYEECLDRATHVEHHMHAMFEDGSEDWDATLYTCEKHASSTAALIASDDQKAS